MADSFWAIPDVTAIRTPLSILREQAAALTQQTHGVLVGEATANPEGERIVVSLDIIAPGLNDYRYRVMRYEQPPEMYPGTLRMGGDGDIISDESDFMASIKKILSSEKMKNVLTSLLAQVTEA